MRYALHRGDCVETMRSMAEASVDAIVTDPPYHLTNAGGGPAGKGQDTPFARARARAGAGSTGFMGQEWDGGDIAFQAETWREALRVLKPGGHLLAFGGGRTYHRLATAIEDAGFEIRDQIMWIYGSGFPKSHNLDGAWQGWGTALKPAHEPICMARKPLVGTVAANVLIHGAGALNIDDCRVGDTTGRWPANVIHDGSDEVLAAFPDAPGQLAAVSTAAPSAKTSNVYGAMRREGDASADSENQGAVGFKMRPGARRPDAGSAARFFYCAKASRSDRNDGLPDPGPQFRHGSTLRDAENLGTDRKGNHHPTVKPTDLMRYLCRLVTPPGGIVLDPFMGSGSTGKAAILEGFRFVGCELQAEYIEIARARIQHAAAVEQHQYELEIA